MRKNYVIIPGTRMAGLFSYVLQAIQNLSVVNETEDKLFIKYTENMLYLDPRVGGNVWDYYFYQPFEFTKEEIINNPKEQAIFIEDEKVVPLGVTSRPSSEMIKVGRELTKKFIRVKPHILEKVDGFIKDTFNGEKYFSIHKRGTDHARDSGNPLLSLKEYTDQADKFFEEYNFGLLCTDEDSTVKAFKERYGDKIKVYDDMIRCDNIQGVHYTIGRDNPYKMGEDVMIDALLMAKSDHLIRTVSNVTIFSILYGDCKVTEMDLHLDYSKFS